MPLNVLFLHQNFPAQYKLLSAELARREDFRVIAMGQGQRTATELNGVSYRRYGTRREVESSIFPPLTFLSEQARRGNSARGQLLELRRSGFVPEICFVHPGWGEAMFLRDVYPQVKLVSYLEFYYRSHGSDLDFDPEFRAPRTDLDFVSLRNLPNLQAAALSDAVISPTHWQAGLFPRPLANRIRILHEGIDTTAAAPGAARKLMLPSGAVISPGQPLVTYVARSLEPYRGFHVFMRALPRLLKQNPTAQVVIVGKEEVSYGRPPHEGGTWKQKLLAEVGKELDPARVHFAGTLAYGELINLFRLSTVHVYLTYPFVLSWSLLEAMASGCAIVGSQTGPVVEVIRDGESGLLTDFFDERELVEKVTKLLVDPFLCESLSTAARQTVVENYDFKRVTLPQYESLITELRRT